MANKSKEKVIDNEVKKIKSTKKSTKRSNPKTKKTASTSDSIKKSDALLVTSKNKETTKKVTKKATSKKNTTRKTKASNTVTKKSVTALEYYDLPFRYNQTIVKVLAQTPSVLFVYWDISDADVQNLKKNYGENFLNNTRPFLIVRNETMNYSFEVEVNDYANSWYLHINDSKCDYKVELGRRPNYYNEEATKEIQENINTDYIYVSSSNEIETPNDHVLFSTNENNTIKFRNIKNNDEKTISLVDFVRSLPALKEKRDIPIISEEIFQAVYSGIYKDEDINFFERLSNPSSGGLATSNMSSSRSALF